MQLVPIMIKYTCGTTIYDRVSLSVHTREVFIAHRLATILKAMESIEESPVMTINIGERTLPIMSDGNGSYMLPEHTKHSVKRSEFRSILRPNRAQRHLNGRYVQMLSAASLGGAIAGAYSPSTWSASSAAEGVSYVFSALILWAAGFYCKKDD
jgi:hypothetical protein